VIRESKKRRREKEEKLCLYASTTISSLATAQPKIRHDGRVWKGGRRKKKKIHKFLYYVALLYAE